MFGIYLDNLSSSPLLSFIAITRRALRALLQENGTILRERTPCEEILMMVLWIMATPDSFRRVPLRFGVHPSELHMHQKYVINGICQLGETYNTWPSAAERERTKTILQRRPGFPGTVGMMDSKRFSITKPVDDPLPHRNYHHGYSMKVQLYVMIPFRNDGHLTVMQRNLNSRLS
ncbi:Protein ANTAGONIST OF LIKE HETEROCHROMATIN PROTEIN 1 [Frankliniella fusca]|uniref:Protein ANTAGONIST OF LIKE HETEROCHROMATIN PROTEIN 1 n=1 Tax=Frankliniella fusca TaxID=407009 RepID=A0AAE1LFW8_9NEOP|nr:Protein ANTAGONIST OF LIKE HETEROCHROMATIN PROTEIN 1 [Frankliniella fusca]